MSVFNVKLETRSLEAEGTRLSREGKSSTEPSTFFPFTVQEAGKMGTHTAGQHQISQRRKDSWRWRKKLVKYLLLSCCHSSRKEELMEPSMLWQTRLRESRCECEYEIGLQVILGSRNTRLRERWACNITFNFCLHGKENRSRAQL